MQTTDTASPSHNCIAELLTKSTEQAKEGEFLKAAEEKLKELADGVSDEENKYRVDEKEGRDALVMEWKRQKDTICDIRKRLESCYGDWEKILKKCVCETVIAELRTLRDKYREGIGSPECELNRANSTLAETAEKLEAWKSITVWIKAQLDKNKALIEEICTLDSCKDHRFALYIFYFELWPAHQALGETPKIIDPESEYCTPACGKDAEPPACCNYPYLIEPDKYDCTLAKAWECWKDAGIAQARAESAFEEIARIKEDYETKSDPETKRKAAAKSLRYCDIEPCASSAQTI